MSDFVFNVAKGRIAELYNRVKLGDPGTSALVLVPLESAGLETDAVLIDKDTLADVLSGATNEQSTMGRKTFNGAALAAIPAPDDVNNWVTRSLPETTYTATAGAQVASWVVCYAPVAGGADSTLVPLTKFDLAFIPNGGDLTLLAAEFFRAEGAA